MENPFVVPPCHVFTLECPSPRQQQHTHTCESARRLGCQSLMMRPIINLPRGNHLEEEEGVLAPPPPPMRHTLHICNRFAVPLGRQRTSAQSLSHSFSPFATRRRRRRGAVLWKGGFVTRTPPMLRKLQISSWQGRAQLRKEAQRLLSNVTVPDLCAQLGLWFPEKPCMRVVEHLRRQTGQIFLRRDIGNSRRSSRWRGQRRSGEIRRKVMRRE